MLADQLFVTLNYAEAVLWIILAVIVGGIGFSWRGKRRVHALVAVPFLIAFGLSDVVETQTGAWWRPWWLFCWKAVCVGVFFTLGVLAGREKRSRM